jgi:hypothetical protein
LVYESLSALLKRLGESIETGILKPKPSSYGSVHGRK